MENMITCSLCGAQINKGCPAVPSDREFVCDACQESHNSEEMAKLAPTITLDGSVL